MTTWPGLSPWLRTSSREPTRGSRLPRSGSRLSSRTSRALVRTLASYWTRVVTWHEFWALIGQYWSRDPWILASGQYWSRDLNTEYWPLIGQYWSRDLNTEYWSLIDQCWSRDLNTSLWLYKTYHVTWIPGLFLVNTDRVTWILTSDWTLSQVRTRCSWRSLRRRRGSERRNIRSRSSWSTPSSSRPSPGEKYHQNIILAKISENI